MVWREAEREQVQDLCCEGSGETKYTNAQDVKLPTYTKVKVEVVGDGSDFADADYPFFMRVRGNNEPDDETGIRTYGLILITGKATSTADIDTQNHSKEGGATLGTILNGVVLRLFTPSNAENRDIEAESDNLNGITAYNLPIWNKIDGYPTVIADHQQRLLFGSSTGYPARCWASKRGRGFNFSYDEGGDNRIVPHGAVSFDISGLTSGGINAFTSKDSLFVHTDNGDYRVRGNTEQSYFSVVSLSVENINSIGSAKAKTQVAGDDIVYIHKSRKQLRVVQESEGSSSVKNWDLSILAEQLTQNDSFKSVVYVEYPNKILWCVMESGRLLGCTYDRQLDVAAWHTHSLSTFDKRSGIGVESMSVTEIEGEETLLLVTREGGSLSYMHGPYVARNNPWYEDECFLDRCITETLTSSTWDFTLYQFSITLSEYFGYGYVLLVNGSRYDPPEAEKTAQIIKLKIGDTVAFGVPYASLAETLPILSPHQHANDRTGGIGTLTNIQRVILDIADTGSIKVYTNDPNNGIVFAKAGLGGALTPTGLQSGIVKGDLNDNSARLKTISISSIDEYPVTVQSLEGELQITRE